MKHYVFTIDDNVRFLYELTRDNPSSLFNHPYTAMLQRLHEEYGAKIQLNLFYEYGDFTLGQMTDRYRDEWRLASEWLKLSFHSRREVRSPYKDSDYGTVFSDSLAVGREILRFAGESSLAKTSTIHYCELTREGVAALRDSGYCGLLGLFGGDDGSVGSYSLSECDCKRVISRDTATRDGITYSKIDLIINSKQKSELPSILEGFSSSKLVKVMIHEQYYYSDYYRYQPDFEDKLRYTLDALSKLGFASAHFEELIRN
ncbi:MAG: hypothetical protein IJW48_02530 [Clostridia bacterium]|nr:hypothetical protein [Clostridia bacterium]